MEILWLLLLCGMAVTLMTCYFDVTTMQAFTEFLNYNPFNFKFVVHSQECSVSFFDLTRSVDGDRIFVFPQKYCGKHYPPF